MTVQITIEIKRCMDCPHLEMNVYRNTWECTKNRGMFISVPEEIPKQCPIYQQEMKNEH